MSHYRGRRRRGASPLVLLHDSFLCDFDVSFESHVNHISLYCVIGALPLVWPRRIQDLCGSPLE